MFTLVSWLSSYNAPTLVMILCLECVLKQIAIKLYLPFLQPSLREVNSIFTVHTCSENEKDLTRLAEQFDSRSKNSSPSPEHGTVRCTWLIDLYLVKYVGTTNFPGITLNTNIISLVKQFFSEPFPEAVIGHNDDTCLKILQGTTFLHTPIILNYPSLPGKVLKGVPSCCSDHQIQANNTIEQNIKKYSSKLCSLNTWIYLNDLLA